jgi:hypothetical protein
MAEGAVSENEDPHAATVAQAVSTPKRISLERARRAPRGRALHGAPARILLRFPRASFTIDGESAYIQNGDFRRSSAHRCPILREGAHMFFTCSRSAIALASALALAASAAAPAEPFAASVAAHRPVHTYSIVARDSITGEMGVAVQSHWFSVGPVVPWARAGVGAVATQSLVLVSYGPLGLDLMEQGMSAREALEKLIDEDEHASVRQVAMVDPDGYVAAHTGDS